MEIQHLQNLARQRFGVNTKSFQKLPSNGSQRRYYRLYFDNFSVMGVYNPNVNENRTFVELSKVLGKHGILVPEILAFDSTQTAYLCTDLGNATLYDQIEKTSQGELTECSFALWAESLRQLAKIQALPLFEPDIFSHCMQPRRFDVENIMWDLHYFKYCFLKLTQTTFDEWALEKEFQTIAQTVSEISLQGFMYRDFQSRNIMIYESKPYCIDFQGARQGPLQYDVASFLYQSRAGLSISDREKLMAIYLEFMENYFSNQRDIFLYNFPWVLLVRVLQVLGAYGYLGLYERKSQFQKTIAASLQELSELFERVSAFNAFVELKRIIEVLMNDPRFQIPKESNNELTIYITSFSFLNGSYPLDTSGHGGGYVFDCRGLPNPGREPKFKNLTGRDGAVVEFLKSNSEVQRFINRCVEIILPHANNFKQRGFTRLNVSFGCSGGQHRSVYCAEAVSAVLKNYGFNVVINHREFPEL